ncbi:hypothetical protein V3C99_007720 [Haemonchus contortus]
MILLSFALSQGVGIIPKSTIPQELKTNMEVTKYLLSKEEIESLNKLNRDKNYISGCYGWRVV